jgi:3-oxoacyl-[acyl-carrier protein] reductase
MNPEDGEFADTMRGVMAIPHYGQPRDITSAVSYLALRESGYITGVNWDVDGGYGV